MITRPISKSISRSIALAINDPNSAGFDPLSLFAAGEQGVWYDPSDLSTLFQDAAGTIPVTAAGQPVGLMRDKSGRGNHATQATATSRPILQTEGGKWYLSFDGIDDSLSTAPINFSATSKATTWVGATKLSDAAVGMICELSPSVVSSNGSFAIYTPSTNGGTDYQAASRGTVRITQSNSSYTAPHKAVLCMPSDISAPSVYIRVNAVASAVNTTSQGTGNYGTWPFYIGRRGGTSFQFTGNVYSLIVRGAASSAQQITDTETYINGKTGAY